MQIRKLIKDYGVVTVTTARQTQPQIVCPTFGDLKYLDFENNIAVTIGSGTIQTGTALLGISGFVVRDKSQQPVVNCPLGTDLPYEIFLLSKRIGKQSTRGKVVSLSNMASSGGTSNLLIPMRLVQADQPAVIDIILGSISDLCSTVGSATATIQVKLYGIWEDASTTTRGLPTQPTLRAEAIPKIASTASGDNLIDMTPSLGRLIVDTGILLDADASLNYLTLMPSGGTGFDTISGTCIIDEENLNTESGHQTAFFSLNHSPYYVSTQTKMNANTASGKALRLFILRESV
jgi:hypothetical protein